MRRRAPVCEKIPRYSRAVAIAVSITAGSLALGAVLFGAVVAGAAPVASAGHPVARSGASAASAASAGPVSDLGNPSANDPATRTVDTPTAFPPSSAARATSIDRLVRAGVAGPERGIAVANLTVTPGQYYLGYAYEARVDSAFAPATLNCGLVDGSGVDRFIADDPVVIESGAGWAAHRQVTTLDAGDVTLAIRCDPATVGLFRAEFRNLDFWAIRMPSGG